MCRPRALSSCRYLMYACDSCSFVNARVKCRAVLHRHMAAARLRAVRACAPYPLPPSSPSSITVCLMIIHFELYLMYDLISSCSSTCELDCGANPVCDPSSAHRGFNDSFVHHVWICFNPKFVVDCFCVFGGLVVFQGLDLSN